MAGKTVAIIETALLSTTCKFMCSILVWFGFVVYVDEVIVGMSMDFDVTDLRLAKYSASTSISVKI